MKYTASQQSEGLRVLGECKGNLSEAARRTGYPRKTIEFWARKVGARGLVPTGRGTERRVGTVDDQDAAKREWRTAMQMNAAELSNPIKVKAANLKDNALAAGISFDKLRLLENASTANLAVATDLATFLARSAGMAPSIEAHIRSSE